MEKDQVIYKKTPGKNSEVIAFLPGAKVNPGRIGSYLRVGQHCEASLQYFYDCKPARVDEYQELHTELTERGYNLDVRKRLAKDWRTNAWSW